MNYVVTIKTLSNGSIENTITKYDNKDTAIRKFHEAFNTIGGGPKRITAMLLEDVETQTLKGINYEPDTSNILTTYSTDVIMNETWTATPEETTES